MFYWQDSFSDFLDYFVRQDMISSFKVNRFVDIDDSIIDIQFSQLIFVGFVSSFFRKFIIIILRGFFFESFQINSLIFSGFFFVNFQIMSFIFRGFFGLRFQIKSFIVFLVKKEDVICFVFEFGFIFGKSKGKLGLKFEEFKLNRVNLQKFEQNEFIR